MMAWSRKWWLWLAVAAIVVVAAIGVVWIISGGQASTPDPLAVHKASEPAEQATIDSAQRMLTGLPAELASGKFDALTPHAKELAGATATALPPDTVIEIDKATWRRTGTVASVIVSARQSTGTTRFLVVLIRDGDRWLVSETHEQSEP